MRASVLVLMVGLGCGAVGTAQVKAGSPHGAECRRAVFEGDVKAGEGFEKVFTKGLKFYLEPLRSGWIVRVLADGAPREAHDYAGLATPPYNSVSPLLVSTDWSFRAQDAIAWNPRRFRYAGSAMDFQKLNGMYAGVVAGDGLSSAKVAELVSVQPEGLFRILDARVVPGLADQGKMAAAVAAHLEGTPHTVDQAVAPSALGSVEEMRFRVELDLLPGVRAAKGVVEEIMSCSVTTAAGSSASQRNIR